jgi:hypothetical protein
LGLADLNLDKRLFHTDGHYDRLLPILPRYGKRVRIETLTEEHLFTLESSDPELDVEAIIAEFGLTEFDTFIGRCTEAQQAARSWLTQEAAQGAGRLRSRQIEPMG